MYAWALKYNDESHLYTGEMIIFYTYAQFFYGQIDVVSLMQRMSQKQELFLHHQMINITNFPSD